MDHATHGMAFGHPVRMVGSEGFEPPALCSQSRCATRLRQAPALHRSEHVERRRRLILQRLQQLDRHADGERDDEGSAATDLTALAVMSARAPG